MDLSQGFRRDGIPGRSRTIPVLLTRLGVTISGGIFHGHGPELMLDLDTSAGVQCILPPPEEVDPALLLPTTHRRTHFRQDGSRCVVPEEFQFIPCIESVDRDVDRGEIEVGQLFHGQRWCEFGCPFREDGTEALSMPTRSRMLRFLSRTIMMIHGTSPGRELLARG